MKRAPQKPEMTTQRTKKFRLLASAFQLSVQERKADQFRRILERKKIRRKHQPIAGHTNDHDVTTTVIATWNRQIVTLRPIVLFGIRDLDKNALNFRWNFRYGSLTFTNRPRDAKFKSEMNGSDSSRNYGETGSFHSLMCNHVVRSRSHIGLYIYIGLTLSRVHPVSTRMCIKTSI